MSKEPAIIIDAKGLNTQPNELRVPAGSLAVAENVEVTRDGVIQVSPGFSDFSSNIPDFLPEQIFAVGGQLYMHLDSGWWYHDGSNWLRKRGSIGSRATLPWQNVVLNGHLYYTANACVIDIDLSLGTISILAGRLGVTGSTDATGDAARFSDPIGLTTNGTDLFVGDNTNNTIRRIVISTKAVTTIAGTVGSASSTDGTGAVARFGSTQGLASDGTNLYASDYQFNTIRRIAPPLTAGAAVVTTIAGTSGAGGFANGTGAAASFLQPRGMVYSGGDLFLADEGNHAIRRIAAPLTAGAGVVTTIAGLGGALNNGTADGTGTVARFTSPHGVTVIGSNLYVSDSTQRIRRVAPPLTSGAAVVVSLAGSSLSTGSADGIGTSARFSAPDGVATDGTDLYVCDHTNNTIRKMYISTNHVATIFGTPGVPIASGLAPFVDGHVQGPS